MDFYRVYHVDVSGQTVGHANFQSIDDHVACADARIIQKERGWHGAELWLNLRHISCPMEGRPT